MDPKVKYIFDAIKKAGVSITDLSRLTSVSRESLYRWKNGNPVADRLRLDIVYRTALRFESACREGKLPFPDRLKKVQRLKALRTIIRTSK